MLRSLQRTTTPASPVSLAEAKLAARIDTSDMDGHVTDLLAAAVERAEHDTNRALCQAEYLLTVPTWESLQDDPAAPKLPFAPPYLELPRPPLISVQTVRYYDTAGVLQTFAAGNFSVDTAPLLGRIRLAPNAAWPNTADRWDAIQIAFTAGYGDPADVPAGLKVGIKKLVAHWFHNPAGDVPPQILRIFESFAVHAWGT